jgi:hypothetical protein
MPLACMQAVTLLKLLLLHAVTFTVPSFRASLWEAAAHTPPAGFEASVARLRELIVRTQQPSRCSKMCKMNRRSWGGGATANARRKAGALLHAIVQGCALVGRWPRPSNSSLTTSNELRRRCTSSHRWSTECYFLPISPCRTACDQDAPPRASIHGPALCGTVQELSVYHTGTHAFFLDRISHMTGLYSELLIMGTLLSWVMRPQPELEEAVLRYGRTLRLDVPGVRHRRLAMHIRRADKHSLNPSSNRARKEQRKDDLWRISDQSYITWSRRVASVIGAEHTLFMSDDAGLLFGPRALEAQGSDGFFRHVPAPASCVPSFAAGLMCKSHVALGGNGATKCQNRNSPMHKLLGTLTMKSARSPEDPPASCGPDYFVDEGVQFYAGLLIMAHCDAFVGTQVSNIATTVVELMASVHHPPLYFDLLGDMYRPFISDDKVWEFGIGAVRRAAEQERMTRADGAARRAVDTNVSNTGIPAMVYSDLKSSGFFQMAPKVAWAGMADNQLDANSKSSQFTSAFHSMTGH